MTGSFQGMLRIYHPKQAGHQVDDLMLEASLDAPVLQLSAGRFIAYGQTHAREKLHSCCMMCDTWCLMFLGFEGLAVCLCTCAETRVKSRWPCCIRASSASLLCERLAAAAAAARAPVDPRIWNSVGSTITNWSDRHSTCATDRLAAPMVCIVFVPSVRPPSHPVDILALRINHSFRPIKNI